MESIDLHLHSCFSDGSDTPEELVLNAKRAGIGLIALTDHNTLAGIGAFREACRRHGQAGIDGIELSCAWRGENAPNVLETADPPEIHVLGYFPPDSDFSSPRFAPLRRVIDEYRLTKIRHNEAIVQKMADAGIADGRLSVPDFNLFAGILSASGNYNRVHIARYLVHLGAARSIDDAMDRYIGKHCPYYVPRRTISVREGIAAVRACGGASVIAHTGEYHFDGSLLEAFFEACTGYGVDGFELLHPHNPPATAAAILSYAARFKARTGRSLLLTSGSDYHGKNKLNSPGMPWDLRYAWD